MRHRGQFWILGAVLEFGFGIFHELLLINVGGASYCKDLLRGRTLTSQQVG